MTHPEDPARRLAARSTHPRRDETNWVLSVVAALDLMADESPFGEQDFFESAGDLELAAAEEWADEHYPEGRLSKKELIELGIYDPEDPDHEDDQEEEEEEPDWSSLDASRPR